MTQLCSYSHGYPEAQEGTICSQLFQWKLVFLGWDCIQSSSTSLKIQPVKTTGFTLFLLFANLCYEEVTILIHCPIAVQSGGRRHNCYIKDRSALPMSMCSLNRALLVFSPSASLSFFWKTAYWFYFLPRKYSDHSKIVNREQNDNFYICWMTFCSWKKIVVSESCQNLLYLKLQLCKSDKAL